MLHEMAAGTPPFEVRTEFELSSRILHEPVAPLPPHVPTSFRAVVDRCLAKDPAQRYQRAADVCLALDGYSALNVSSIFGARALPSIRPRILVSVAAVAVALLVLNHLFTVRVQAITSVVCGARRLHAMLGGRLTHGPGRH